MTNRNRWALVLWLATACGSPGNVDDPSDTEDADSGSQGADASTGGSVDDPNPSGGTTTGASDDGAPPQSEGDSTSSDGGSEDTCGTECVTSEPQVRWIAEPSHDLAGGTCMAVVGDGEGGLVASFITNPDSPLAGGLVVSTDADGAIASERTLEQRQVTGLERTTAGTFRWVDSYANAGSSPALVDALTGEWLATDLLAIDDLATIADGFAYAVVVNGFFPECRIRSDLAGFVDTPALPCGQSGDRWRLKPDPAGSAVGGLVGQSALVRIDEQGGLTDVLDARYQRLMLDLAVDELGRVWTVGVIKNPNEAGPSFGSFVARHDPTLAEEPEWEVLEQGDTTAAWTSVVVEGDEPVLVGRNGDGEPRILALTSDGDQRWELSPDLPPSALLRHAELDEEGRLFVCGDRFDADVPYPESGPVLGRIDL
ncbi:MAG: hypothetical protein AAF721_16790 [Myxococcota bacterium]